jgi:predicted RNase H-like HicB family nuclease
VKDTAHYIKIVEWSEEDKCYIGSSPGLFYGGCHGEDEQDVFRELCQIVEETIADMHANEQPLPPTTTWRGLVSRQDVA